MREAKTRKGGDRREGGREMGTAPGPEAAAAADKTLTSPRGSETERQGERHRRFQREIATSFAPRLGEFENIISSDPSTV